MKYSLGDLNQKAYVLVYPGSDEHAGIPETDDVFTDSLDVCPKIYFS